MENLIDIHHL